MNLGDTSLSIFLAYSEQDEAFAQRLASDLRGALGRAGTVHAESPLGREGDAAAWRDVQAQIATADVYMVVVSPSAMASPWINAQVDVAWRRRNEGLVIVPVQYRASQLREDLALVQFVSFLPPNAYGTALAETRALLSNVQAQKLASVQMRTTSLAVPSLPFADASPIKVPSQPQSFVRLTRRRLVPLLSVALLGVVAFTSLLLVQRKAAADQALSLAAQTRVAVGQATRIALTHVANQTQVVVTLTASAQQATAAAVVTATYQAGQSYSASVPGCPDDGNWKLPSSPDAQHPTFVCNSDNIQLLNQPSIQNAGDGLQFTGAQSYKAGLPVRHDMQIDVYDLQPHGQEPNFSFGDGLFTFVWGGQYWHLFAESPSCNLCLTGNVTLPDHFTVRMVYDGKQVSVYVDGTLYGSIVKASDYQVSNGISVQYDTSSITSQSVSMRVKNFRFTPLH